MLTFYIQASNGNYYIGHGVGGQNCWGDYKEALVMSIEQIRELMTGTWLEHGGRHIEVHLSSVPISDEQFKRELYALKYGGYYHHPMYIIELNIAGDFSDFKVQIQNNYTPAKYAITNCREAFLYSDGRIREYTDKYYDTCQEANNVLEKLKNGSTT